MQKNKYFFLNHEDYFIPVAIIFPQWIVEVFFSHTRSFSKEKYVISFPGISA